MVIRLLKSVTWQVTGFSRDVFIERDALSSSSGYKIPYSHSRGLGDCVLRHGSQSVERRDTGLRRDVLR
jgi:hypothetical protein